MFKTGITMLTLFSLLLGMEGHAQDIQVQAAEILGYGVFESVNARRTRGYRAHAPGADSIDGLRFTNITHDIPGELGTEFGLQYVINSSPKGSTIQVTKVIRFPGNGLTQPGGRTYTVSREQRAIRIGEPDIYGFGFDEAWEIVPGPWIFEIWHNDARIIRKSFNVVVPAT